MAASQSRHISVVVTLAAAPLTRAGFGSLLLLVDEAGGTNLNGDRFRSYSSYTEVAADVTAGYVSATVGAAAQDIFGNAGVASLLIGRVDTGSGTPETYPGALQLCIDDGANFYGVACDSRADAVIVALSAAVEALAQPAMLIVQSDDATWLTSGLPSGLTALAGKERTAVLYHTTDAEWGAECWAASRLKFDLDAQSAGWTGSVQNVAAYTSNLSSTQIGFLEANYCNYGLPFGSTTFFVYKGVTCAGRPIYHQVTADWLEVRLQEDMTQLLLDYAARGAKLPIDIRGQAQVQAIIEARLKLAEQAGHIKPGQWSVTMPTITSADIAAERLRATVVVTLLNGATSLSITVNASTTDVYPE